MKKRTPSSWSRRRGTTLFEVTAAMSVMAASLLSLLSLLTYSVRTKERQRELETARQAAASVHESLKAQTVGSTPAGQAIQDYLKASWGPPVTQIIGGRSYEVTTLPVPGLTWTRWTPSNGTASTQGVGTVTVDTSNPQLVAVTVQVDWKSYGRNTRFSLRALYAMGYFK